MNSGHAKSSETHFTPGRRFLADRPPVIEYDARARRSARAADGWLTSLIRARVAERRRAESDGRGTDRRD